MKYFYFYLLTFGSMCLGYLKAKFGPKTTFGVYFRRYSECLKCASIEEHKGDFYCGACGCPRWADSKLENKLKMQNSVCPKKKWK